MAEPDTLDLSSKLAHTSRECMRPWLGVLFRCSGAYQRVYRNAVGTAYLARCPRCGKSVTFRVGVGGTRERFFEVHC